MFLLLLAARGGGNLTIVLFWLIEPSFLLRLARPLFKGCVIDNEIVPMKIKSTLNFFSR